MRPTRHHKTFRKPLLQKRSPIVGQRFISRLVSHLFVTPLRGGISIRVNPRRMQPIGIYHFQVVLLFVPLLLGLLAKVLRQCKMLFRRVGGIDQACRLPSTQLFRRDGSCKTCFRNLCSGCPDRPNQNQGCEYCGFHMSSFHGHCLAVPSRSCVLKSSVTRRSISIYVRRPAMELNVTIFGVVLRVLRDLDDLLFLHCHARIR